MGTSAMSGLFIGSMTTGMRARAADVGQAGRPVETGASRALADRVGVKLDNVIASLERGLIAPTK